MIDSDFQDAKVTQFAQLKPDTARLYPGIWPDAWHGVLDRGATIDGVFLAIKPPRFVWRRHFEFRNLPPPAGV